MSSETSRTSSKNDADTDTDNTHVKYQDNHMNHIEFGDDFKLEDYLSHLYVSKEYADVEITITSAEGRESLWCHKIILSRSAVFRAMLSSKMIEGNTSKIEIQDVSPNVFKFFLDFLYCDELPEVMLPNGGGLELLQLADRYEIRSLFDKMIKEYKFSTDDLLECCELWIQLQQTSKNKDVVSRLIKRIDVNENLISSDMFAHSSKELAIFFIKAFLKGPDSEVYSNWNSSWQYTHRTTVVAKAISYWVKYHHPHVPKSKVYKYAKDLTRCIENDIISYVSRNDIIEKYISLNIFYPEFLLKTIARKWGVAVEDTSDSDSD